MNVFSSFPVLRDVKMESRDGHGHLQVIASAMHPPALQLSLGDNASRITLVTLYSPTIKSVHITKSRH